jgi:hypothetical protein
VNDKELYEFITSELRSYCNRNGIPFHSFMARKLTDLLQELESEEEYEAYKEAKHVMNNQKEEVYAR